MTPRASITSSKAIGIAVTFGFVFSGPDVVSSVASADPLGAGEGTVYRLNPESSYQEGCFPPCMCPILEQTGVRGTFTLAYDGSDQGIHTYTIVDVNWTLPLGPQLRIFGTGTYEIGSPGPLPVVQHRMQLDLQIGDGPSEHFDSWWVLHEQVSGINITVSINGMYCWDIAIAIDASAVPDDQIQPYALLGGSTFQRGCYDPCDCPLGPELPMVGTFKLIHLVEEPLYLSEYAVVDVTWHVLLESTGESIPVTGFGVYQLLGDFVLQERLALELIIGDEERTHFDSGPEMDVLFPRIDAIVSIYGIECYDTVLHVLAEPIVGAVCGGIAGIPCEEGEFCKLPTGACCCDHFGMCTPIPSGCPEYYDPVCGCDGVTYDNECFSDAAGVSVLHLGVCEGAIGPDLIVGGIPDIHSYGTEGDVSAFSVATEACNVGDQRVSWIAYTNEHPVVGQNMYRLKQNRFEQVGMSWLAHGFYALSQSTCGTCADPTDGSELGVGCSSPHSAPLNGLQGNMGPRSDVNGYTGYFPYPPNISDPPCEQCGLTDRRLQVHNADLDPTSNAESLYFVEGHYVATDEATAGNGNDNVSYRRILISGPHDTGALYQAAVTDTVQRRRAAVRAWGDLDPTVFEAAVEVPDEGLFILAAKATELGNGSWQYEYALQNVNSHRSCGSFSVPLPSDVAAGTAGFHDVDYHSGESFDGTDWEATVSGGAIAWATSAYEINPKANALRWGTLYNFRFEANAPPQSVEATIGLFRPGFPGSVHVQTLGPTGTPGEIGACCEDISDGPIPYESCSDSTQEICEASAGLFHADTLCEEVQACCFGGDFCHDMNPSCCMDSGGVPLGTGSTCSNISECPQICGGLGPGPGCPDDQFCKLPEGVCGAGYAYGVCTPIPAGCPDPVVDPVCGCNGVPYMNECESDMAGVSLFLRDACPWLCCDPDAVPPCLESPCCCANGQWTCSDGGGCSPCEAPGEVCRPVCGGPIPIHCEGTNSFCKYREGVCGASAAYGLCTHRPLECVLSVYDPVCGCDGVTYDTECYADAAGVSVDYWGECGIGACCVDDSTYNAFCFLGTETDCLTKGGTYLGAGTSCPFEQDVCVLPPDPGPCEGICPRFYHDTCTGQCESFTYGCCDGNANNFVTLEECEAACLATEHVCLLEPDPGPCDGVCPRFFYNACAGQCESFGYGCCDGNANNFVTLADCERACPPPGSVVSCGPPIGACCMYESGDTSFCLVRTEAECLDAGGAYQGDGTECPPDPNMLCGTPCDGYFCPHNQDCFSACGELVQGAECILFQADSGGMFILANLGGFSVGDRVSVTGCHDPNCANYCMQGGGCIRNNTIEPCGQVCGGIAGIPCDNPDEFCKFPEGTCGMYDIFGVCTPVPGGPCPAVWDPVCGCNGITYGNECEADTAGVSVDYRGECVGPACAAARVLSDPDDLSYCPGVTKTVRIVLAPPFNTSAIAVEDSPPAGWVVSNISDGGTFDTVNRKVKWGPLFPPFPAEVTYEVTPTDASGVECFTGTISIDGVNESICGDQCIDACCPYIPADTPQAECLVCPVGDCRTCDAGTCADGQVSMCELVGYACAWMRGCNDDLSGMTRAAYVWHNGECYCWDDAEQHWVPTSCAGSVSACCGGGGPGQGGPGVSETPPGVAVARFHFGRTKRLSGIQLLEVPITVAAPAGTSAMALDCKVPPGWRVIEVSDGGVWDEVHRKVKWGPLMDDLSRTVTFTARRLSVMPAIKTGRVRSEKWLKGFTGTVSFDGVNQAIRIE